MWPFAQKANPASRVIVLGLNVQGPSAPIAHKDFAGLARQSYERGATVYGCVSTIAQACATVPWVLYERGRTKGSKMRRLATKAAFDQAFIKSLDFQTYPRLRKALELTEIEQHPLLTLLERPNESQSQSDYVEQLLSYLLIAGNGYEQFLAPETGPNKGRPLEMWNHRPDRIEILVSKTEGADLIAGYQYKVGANKEPFPAASIIHHKFFNPTDDFYGMSPLQAAIRAWQTENLGADWNFALLNNAARPSGMLVVPTTLSEDVYERLKTEITSSYAGAKNAGSPMLGEGGIKWEQMSLSPMELDFLAGMRDAAIRICRVYHLAPEIIGVPDAKTYNSLAEARKAMWQEACLPLLDRLRNRYNQRLVPAFGDRIFLDYDRDEIDAIQEDQGKVWDKLNRTKFLSTNEKRLAAGYESYDDAEGVADIPESVLNPTPGATSGEPGFPAGTVTSLRSVLRDAVEHDLEIAPEHKAAALAVIDSMDAKEQKLTAKQKQLQATLRKAMSRHFKHQGADLAAYLQREIGKL